MEAGRALGLEIVIVEADSDRDFEAAFATMVERRVDAFVLSTFPFPNLGKVVALAARHKLPAMYTGRGLTGAGGLVSYGADFTNVYVQVESTRAKFSTARNPRIYRWFSRPSSSW